MFIGGKLPIAAVPRPIQSLAIRASSARCSVNKVSNGSLKPANIDSLHTSDGIEQARSSQLAAQAAFCMICPVEAPPPTSMRGLHWVHRLGHCRPGARTGAQLDVRRPLSRQKFT